MRYILFEIFTVLHDTDQGTLLTASDKSWNHILGGSRDSYSPAFLVKDEVVGEMAEVKREAV